MGDIQDRPFSKNYSGLLNQSVIAISLIVISVTSHEFMKRKRRGRHLRSEPLGSVESWQFGYLYQGRSWAKKPSPPAPIGWPLAWLKDSLTFPPEKLNELRGIDATLYLRFLKGCMFFVLLHTFTTVPILLPIHVHFSPDDVPSGSMIRASISSLVLTAAGKKLLWIHICIMFWIAITWVGNLIYIINGAFKFRQTQIEAAARRAASHSAAEKDAQYHPHPHPQFPFQDIPALDNDHSNRGIRWRTVMVSNVPVQLRSERELREYFEFYMSQPLDMPSVGLPSSSTQPGVLNKFLAFGFNRAKQLPSHLPNPLAANNSVSTASQDDFSLPQIRPNNEDTPVIDRVVVARKMTELASLLQRREDILKQLETAHIKLAKKVLVAVYHAMQDEGRGIRRKSKRLSKAPVKADATEGGEDDDVDDHMSLLIHTLGPFVEELGVAKIAISAPEKLTNQLKGIYRRLHPTDHNLEVLGKPGSEAKRNDEQGRTVWDALLSLPREALDRYQPLIHLSVLFRGRTVPSIDYYTAKLNLVTSLITENRARAINDFAPVSTAFVTFADPKDARKACKYLAVHPKNPMACLVSMAPQYEDLDWTRVMKSTYRGEILKDFFINIGVWGFTIFWLFPVSLFVGLVSIQNISTFWPQLSNYLAKHSWEEEIIQSFLPTVLVALLTILIPLLLLLLAKKGHVITTLSALHDLIMTRYYKFLIVNVLVFFCVGTAALQSVLTSVNDFSGATLLSIVSESFPSAGPFYVGWLIFTTAMHSSFELVMFGLPLFVYPNTQRQVTPRKRAVGIRPRTYNYYYWLPNHLLIIHVLLLFAVLNPLVIPFGLIYFAVENAVIKNQLLHVYAKNYECNGQMLLIRMIRYSMDGLLLSQSVFLAYMVVLEKTVNYALAAVLIILTAATKVIITRMCRARFEKDDLLEAEITCGTTSVNDFEEIQEHEGPFDLEAPRSLTEGNLDRHHRPKSGFRTWRHKPEWMNFSYNEHPQRKNQTQRRQPIPFGMQRPAFSRLSSMDQERKQGIKFPGDSRQSPTNGRIRSVLGGPLVNTPTAEDVPEPNLKKEPLVEKHPPHPAWDDTARYDIPYENPFYNRPISNALWLPRDPCGLLDLDDTVVVRLSLTSELTAGELGVWFGAGLSTTLPAASPTPFAARELASSLHVPSSRLSGREDIDLPPGIQDRVSHIENEDDVEYAGRENRPSLFNRRRSSSASAGRLSTARQSRVSMPRMGSSKSQTFDVRGREGSSLLATEFGSLRPRTASSFTTNTSPSSARPFLPPRDPGSKPDLHAQAEFARSMTGFVQSTSFPATTAQSTHVTTREAVVNEVIVEEQIAAEERLRQEAAEAEPVSTYMHTWLPSRFFSRRRR